LHHLPRSLNQPAPSPLYPLSLHDALPISSSPRISVRTEKRLPSLMSPMAIPATCAFIGTPASMSARLAPQTEAMEDEPFDSVISDRKSTRLNSSHGSISYAVFCLKKKKNR